MNLPSEVTPIENNNSSHDGGARIDTEIEGINLKVKGNKRRFIAGSILGGILFTVSILENSRSENIYSNYTSVLNENEFVSMFPDYSSRGQAFDEAVRVKRSANDLFKAGLAVSIVNTAAFLFFKRQYNSKISQIRSKVNVSENGIGVLLKF